MSREAYCDGEAPEDVLSFMGKDVVAFHAEVHKRAGGAWWQQMVQRERIRRRSQPSARRDRHVPLGASRCLAFVLFNVKWP